MARALSTARSHDDRLGHDRDANLAENPTAGVFSSQWPYLCLNGLEDLG
jgi:hypothetical protein